MKKFLINASFGYYPNGTYKSCPMFALIIDFDVNNEKNMSPVIETKLKELNFRPDSMGYFVELTFTAQQIV